MARLGRGVPSRKTVRAVGVATGTGPQTISPSAIDTAEAWGTTVLTPGAVTISPTGIATTETWGATVLTPGPVTISPAGIASAEVFGAAMLLPGPVTVSPSGVASTETWGVATVTATATISPSGIGSTEAWGTTTLIPGDVSISPSGVASGEAWGIPLLVRATMFFPPVEAVVPPIWPECYAPTPSQRLFRHYKPRYEGRSVYKLTDGTYTETAPYPNIDASTQPGQFGDTTVLKTYLGGHYYEISADEAAALIAAGYGAYVS